ILSALLKVARISAQVMRPFVLVSVISSSFVSVPVRSGGWLRAGDEPLDGLEGAKLLMAAVGGGPGPVAAGVKLNTTIGVNDNSMADAAIPVAAPIVLREGHIDPLSPRDSIPYPGRLHAGQLSDT